MWDGVNRRKFPRAEYPCLITVRTSAQPAQAVLTHTANVSVGGLLVTIGKKIEVMTEVDLEIDLKDTLPNVTAKGTICWVKQISARPKGKSKSYEIGIQFTALKDEDRKRIRDVVSHLLHRGL